jgi:hypothetical protein
VSDILVGASPSGLQNEEVQLFTPLTSGSMVRVSAEGVKRTRHGMVGGSSSRRADARALSTITSATIGARRWAQSLALTSLATEAYARGVDDIKDAVTFADPKERCAGGHRHRCAPRIGCSPIDRDLRQSSLPRAERRPWRSNSGSSVWWKEADMLFVRYRLWYLTSLREIVPGADR